MPKVVSLAAAAEKENASRRRMPEDRKRPSERKLHRSSSSSPPSQPLGYAPKSSLSSGPSADSAYTRGVLKSSGSGNSGRVHSSSYRRDFSDRDPPNRRDYSDDRDDEGPDAMYDDEYVNPVVSRAPNMLMPMSSPPMKPHSRRDEAVAAAAVYESAGPSRREKLLEERIRQLTSERDAVQTDFDELRALRLTEPERLMAELKRAADQQTKQSSESVRSLSRHLEACEARIRELEQQQQQPLRSQGPCEECQRSTGMIDNLKHKLRDRQDEVLRLQAELDTRGPAARSQAIPSGAAAASAAPSDQRAVLKLYEDLTGIIVNRIEPADLGSENGGHGNSNGPLRFSMVFACEGYHDLAFSLQESQSNLPPSSSSARPLSSSSTKRDDLVYCPHLDADRDADLLRSRLFPQHLRDDLRFDRALSVKFLSTMQGKLKRA